MVNKVHTSEICHPFRSYAAKNYEDIGERYIKTGKAMMNQNENKNKTTSVEKEEQQKETHEEWQRRIKAEAIAFAFSKVPAKELRRRQTGEPPMLQFQNKRYDENIVRQRENDVLFGRGGGTNRHPGNIWGQQFMEDRKNE